jgi:CMP/dCMP kinase
VITGAAPERPRGGEVAVAIDGPAGAGKSTVSRAVARRLGYVLLDTGAIYRCVALAAQRRSVDWGDEAALGALAQELAARDAIAFTTAGDGAEHVWLEGEDVTTSIRTLEMGQGASRVSAQPSVRAALLDLQRRAAHRGGVVLEGRDIGSVVLPDAEAKFFLTASVGTRAERRHRELRARGTEVSPDEVRREVIERDHRDSTRPVAPLTQAPDAIVVDSTSMSIDEVVELMVRHVEGLRRARSGPGRP